MTLPPRGTNWRQQLSCQAVAFTRWANSSSEALVERVGIQGALGRHRQQPIDGRSVVAELIVSRHPAV